MSIAYFTPLTLRIKVIKLLKTLGIAASIAPHAREKHLGVGIVFCLNRPVNILIFPIQRSPILTLLELPRSAVILTVEQRRTAVLFAGEITHQSKGVVRLIFVGGSFGAGADNIDGKQRKTYDYAGEAKQDRIPKHLLLFMSGNDAPEAKH